MKKLLPFIIVLIVLQSCNTQLRVEKRRYAKGYYIANSERSKCEVNKFEQSIDFENDTLTYISEAIRNNTPLKKNADLEQIAVLDTLSSPKTITDINSDTEQFQSQGFAPKSEVSSKNAFSDKTDVFSKVPLLNKMHRIISDPLNSHNSNNNKRGKAQIIVGVILLSVGTYVFWFTSLLIGSAMLLVGLILLIVGAVRYGKKNPKTSEELEEVVYLKNGSIIRGVILEQVIDDYVKIQMKDGSIFVYKMTEIIKITKEKKFK